MSRGLFGIHILVAFFLLAIAATKSFAIGTPSVSGSILRDTSIGYFDVTVTITDVSKTAKTAKEKDLFKDRLRFWLTDLSTATTEYIPFEGDTAIASVPFTVKSQSDLVQNANSNNLTDFIYTVRITAINSGGLKKLLDDKGSGKSLKLTVKYYEDLIEITKNESITISVSTAIVQDAPSTPSTAGTHKAIVATWTPTTTVAWSDTTSKAAKGISALVIDKSTTTSSIPAYIYDNTAVTDSEAAEGTCTFIPDFVDGTSCINCSNSNAYLNTTKLETLASSGLFYKSATVSEGKISVPGLENGKDYAVVLFYQPGGLNRSACKTGIPEANKTWSELNGEGDATLSDPKCFIATAAYGSVLHKNLKPLRWFRDRVLLKTKIGKAFVTWYYQYGPRGASVVSAYPSLQLLVQGLLWIPVLLLSGWMAIAGNDPNLIMTLLTAFVAALIAVVYIARKTREDL